jgi:hypothetical protein
MLFWLQKELPRATVTDKKPAVGTWRTTDGDAQGKTGVKNIDTQ